MVKSREMILAFCNQKGGSGKTTLCLATLLALEMAGQSVGFLDIDPQKTLTRALLHLNEHGFSQIQPARHIGGLDALVIDTPPDLTGETRSAVLMANKAFLVTSPSPADMWSSQDTLKFMKMSGKKGLDIRLLFNSVDLRTCLARDLHHRARQIGGKCLARIIPRTSEMQYMFVRGLPALSVSNRKAILELALEIVKM